MGSPSASLMCLRLHEWAQVVQGSVHSGSSLPQCIPSFAFLVASQRQSLTGLWLNQGLILQVGAMPEVEGVVGSEGSIAAVGTNHGLLFGHCEF